ncbi:MAG: hypothetical protein HY914_08255 [Desulfomonile tiedjei]|nr:hypothetical protein [Desulfomonile tiedjei]
MGVRMMVAVGVLALGLNNALAGSDFPVAENALGEFRSVRHESLFTTVPTTGKLISIKITDSGKIYYICKEKSGYAIYNLEIRPVENFQEKLRQELKEKTRKWDQVEPDDLLFTKEKHEQEIKRHLRKYCDAVWVRNEIIVREPAQPDPRKQ